MHFPGPHRSSLFQHLKVKVKVKAFCWRWGIHVHTRAHTCFICSSGSAVHFNKTINGRVLAKPTWTLIFSDPVQVRAGGSGRPENAKLLFMSSPRNDKRMDTFI